MRLSDLAKGATAVIHDVEDTNLNDPISRRLRELEVNVVDRSQAAKEPVRIVAQGPIGGDPLLVQIGFTRFALRRAEAARVQVIPEELA